MSGRLSIPAWFDWRLVDALYELFQHDPFNPSLVRLAPRPSTRPLHPRPHFNPSLVRLAGQELHRPAVGWTFFQSQLGSIGAGS